jgi:hypothetical protein
MPLLVHCSRNVRLLLENSKYHLADGKVLWSEQELRRLSLLDTNIMPIQNNNRQAALHSALINYSPLVMGGGDKNKQLTIIKPT